MPGGALEQAEGGHIAEIAPAVLESLAVSPAEARSAPTDQPGIKFTSEPPVAQDLSAAEPAGVTPSADLEVQPVFFDVEAVEEVGRPSDEPMVGETAGPLTAAEPTQGIVAEPAEVIPAPAELQAPQAAESLPESVPPPPSQEMPVPQAPPIQTGAAETPGAPSETTYTLREPHQRPRFAPRRGRRGRRGAGYQGRSESRWESRPGNNQPVQISKLLKEGQEILVQISKEPLGTKGARITSHIALPGRYLVYMPTVEHIGVSRKISSEEERLRLRNVILEHKGSLTGGFIVRTAGQGDVRGNARTLRTQRLLGDLDQNLLTLFEQLRDLDRLIVAGP